MIVEPVVVIPDILSKKALVKEKFKSEKLRGIFHCFTGNLDQANKIIDLNFHLGIGGVVTFKNGKISEFLNAVPIDKIVLETDSPYLAPAPYRGKRNEPAYVVNTARVGAELFDLSYEEFALQTEENFNSLFFKARQYGKV